MTQTPTRTTRVENRTLRIARDLNGPRNHANGGFACGTFGGLVDGPAVVRLARKVPLERDLDAARVGTGWVVHDGTRRLAEVRPHEPIRDEPPVRPTLEAARQARAAHPFRGVRHALSTCVVCGPDRTDGLEVTPGPLAGSPEVLAAPFVVKPAFARAGTATVESVWGALDCVSFPAVLLHARRIGLLGEQAVQIHRVPVVGEELVAVGWSRGAGTRSHRTASALLDAQGNVVASARAIWVEARHQPLMRAIGKLR